MATLYGIVLLKVNALLAREKVSQRQKQFLSGLRWQALAFLLLMEWLLGPARADAAGALRAGADAAANAISVILLLFTKGLAMDLSSVIEIYTSVLGWILYDGMWAALAESGLLYIPIVAVVLSN